MNKQRFIITLTTTYEPAYPMDADEVEWLIESLKDGEMNILDLDCELTVSTVEYKESDDEQ